MKKLVKSKANSTIDRKTPTQKDKKSIILFLIITGALSSIFYFLVIWGGEKFPNLLGVFAYALMWCPGIAAIVISKVYYPKENIIGFRRCSLKYILAGIFIPIFYWSISYGIYLLKFGTSVITYDTVINLIKSPLTLLLYLLIFFITAMGEEVGWRGFLAPKLNELFGFNKAALLGGLIWALWHYPLFFAGYMSDIQLWYQIPVLTLLIFALSFLFAYVRLWSNSVWPAVLIHFSHNFFAQLILDQSIGGDMRPYLVGETGIVSIVVIIILTVLITKKYTSKAMER